MSSKFDLSNKLNKLNKLEKLDEEFEERLNILESKINDAISHVRDMRLMVEYLQKSVKPDHAPESMFKCPYCGNVTFGKSVCKCNSVIMNHEYVKRSN